MLSPNGTWVSRIRKSRAGSSGSRRRHDSLMRESRPTRRGTAAVPASVSSPPHLGCDVLAVLERRIDRRPTGDHRGELLGALVADVLELRDADVLNPRDARP